MASTNLNNDQLPPTEKTFPNGRRSPRVDSATSSRSIYETYRLSRPLFARLLGMTESRLLEEETRSAEDFKAKRDLVTELLNGLSRSIPAEQLADWLTTPNEASLSAGSSTPADLMREGQYDKIEAMIYFFESGAAY